MRRGSAGRRALAAAFVAATALSSGTVGAQPPREIIGEVRIHGNHTTPDADVLTLADLTVGTPVTEAVISQAAERLRASGRFADVEVRKRHRSIEDASDILVIVVVDEHAAVSSGDLTPGPMKRLAGAGMWLPIVDYADGYGFTYGGRVSFVGAARDQRRLSVPLTWGGERRAAVEVGQTFARGPVTRLEGSFGVTRRVNPHFDLSDRREEVRVRVERALASWGRVGGDARWTRLTFGGQPARLATPAVDVTLDTRLDPAFPRNALHVVARAEQLRFDDGARVGRWTLDGRGYVGLLGSSVFAVRGRIVQASRPLPAYERALLGGTQTLRGYAFGYQADDNLALASAELRVPLTSSMSLGRLGIRAFVDAGTVHASRTAIEGRRFDRGIGGGVFFTAPLVHGEVDIAWPRTGSPRVHVGLGVTF